MVAVNPISLSIVTGVRQSAKEANNIYTRIRFCMERFITPSIRQRMESSHGVALLEMRCTLAHMLLRIYSLSGDEASLEECVLLYQDLLDDDTLLQPVCRLVETLDGLGEALCARYFEYGHIADIQTATASHKKSLHLRACNGLDSTPALKGIRMALDNQAAQMQIINKCVKAPRLQPLHGHNTSCRLSYNERRYNAIIYLSLCAGSPIPAFAMHDTVPSGPPSHARLREQGRDETSTLWEAALAPKLQSTTTHDIQDIHALENSRYILWHLALRSRQSQEQSYASVTHRLSRWCSFFENPTEPNSPAIFADLLELVKYIDEISETFQRDFIFKSLSPEQMFSAVQEGYIVLLLSNGFSANAVVVRGKHRDILTVPLTAVNEGILYLLGIMLDSENQEARDGLSMENSSRKLCRKSRRRQSAYDEALSKIWFLVVRPVIHALGLERNVGHRPRAYWCPTGPFTFLPLHAAGVYERGTPLCTSDYLISSYIPTITSFVEARRKAPSCPINKGRLLLAAVPNAPGYASLPHTETEVDIVQELLPSSVSLKGHVPSQAFLAELTDASFLHLACHGKQDPHNALNSGFVFSDGTVKLASFMSARVPNACFAFLSACESAAGDRDFPDESIHLTAAMLFMGYRSVIGTMWSMHDADGPIVARHIYSELLKSKESFDYDVVPRALDAAVRELRDTGVHPSRWATWIHTGI